MAMAAAWNGSLYSCYLSCFINTAFKSKFKRMLELEIYNSDFQIIIAGVHIRNWEYCSARTLDEGK